MAYISQRQLLVRVDGLAGYFMTKQGGDITADSNKIYPGGQKTPEIITGIPEVDNLTVGRAYEPSRDNAVLALLRGGVGSWKTTITVTDTDPNFSTVNGSSVTYANAVLVGLTEPEVDSSSGDPAEIELEFAVPSVATTVR